MNRIKTQNLENYSTAAYNSEVGFSLRSEETAQSAYPPNEESASHKREDLTQSDTTNTQVVHCPSFTKLPIQPRSYSTKYPRPKLGFVDLEYHIEEAPKLSCKNQLLNETLLNR